MYKPKSERTIIVYAFDDDVANFHKGHTITYDKIKQITMRIIDLRNFFIIKKIEPHYMRLLPFLLLIFVKTTLLQ